MGYKVSADSSMDTRHAYIDTGKMHTQKIFKRKKEKNQSCKSYLKSMKWEGPESTVHGDKEAHTQCKKQQAGGVGAKKTQQAHRRLILGKFTRQH